MSDMIDRQTAIDALCGMKLSDGQSDDEKGSFQLALTLAVGVLRELPSAHPTQKEAKWKTAYLDHESMGRRPKILYCSRCNQCAAYPTDFCPACGADMRRLI